MTEDLFCTDTVKDLLQTMTPDDVDEYIEEEEALDGCVIVTDGFSATYLLSQDDFKRSSRLIEFDEQYMVVEYFENGIPEWLEPLPRTVYMCEWNGDDWTFTKVS